MADLTVSNSNKSTAVPTESEPTSDPVDTESDTPKDVAEQDTGDSGVATKDKSWLTRVTDATKDASQKAWELTAAAQRKVNEPKTWKEKTIATAGGDHLEIRDHEAKQPDLGGGKGNPAGYFGLLGAADQADSVASVVKNADAIRAAENARRASDIIDSGKVVPGHASKAIGYAGLGVSVAVNGSKVVEDVFDEDGISTDSVVPLYNVAVDGVSTFVRHPLVLSYSVGHTIGTFIYDDLGAGEAIDRAHTRSIEQHTQLGIVEDRAPRFDGAARQRFETGNATEEDFSAARTVSREAHEHGLIREDGTVDKYEFVKQVPSLTMRELEGFMHGDRVSGTEHHYRVLEGIELAVRLDKMAQSREPSDPRRTAVSTAPSETR